MLANKNAIENRVLSNINEHAKAGVQTPWKKFANHLNGNKESH